MSIIVNAVMYTVGPICHWIYASQYIKTCFLTQGIVKKAVLLLERHRTVIGNSYEHTSSFNNFVRKNVAID